VEWWPIGKVLKAIKKLSCCLSVHFGKAQILAIFRPTDRLLANKRFSEAEKHENKQHESVRVNMMSLDF
jgi:hypothetical protein